MKQGSATFLKKARFGVSCSGDHMGQDSVPQITERRASKTNLRAGSTAMKQGLGLGELPIVWGGKKRER